MASEIQFAIDNPNWQLHIQAMARSDEWADQDHLKAALNLNRGQA